MPSKPSSCCSYEWSSVSRPLGFDPRDLELEVCVERAVDQRFLQRLVAVLILDVLADDADVDFVPWDGRRDARDRATWRGQLPSHRAAGT